MKKFKEILRDLSIRQKIMVISLSVTAIVILIISLIHLVDEVLLFQESAEKELHERAELVSYGLGPLLKEGRVESIKELLPLLESIPGIVQAVVYDKEGSIVAQYSYGEEALPAPPYKKSAHMPGAYSVQTYYPIKYNGEPIGTLYLRADLIWLYSYLKEHLAGFVVMVVVSFGVVYLFLARIQRWVTEPIGKLVEIMGYVSSTGDYSVRVPIESRDEIGKLAEGFNSMIEEIERREKELDARVKERTAELNKALEDMKSYRDRLEDACIRLRESEKNLVQAAKLASLGELGAGIAHELNSPLAGILSITEVLLRRCKPDDPNYFFLEKIKDASLRARNIIVDLLSYSRPTKDRMETLDLNDVIKSTLSLFISELKTTSVEMHEELAHKLPPIKGNKGQLMEVFLNLIKNARDALGGAGCIFIRTYTTERDGRRFVVGEVEDTGSGIPDDVKDSIFDPFFTTKEKGGGLNIGLGLCICKSIVETHGGIIEFESSAGEGTVFRVLLPEEEQNKPNKRR